jgi:uncharacterized membrane protein YuzA (DUF378 family)
MDTASRDFQTVYLQAWIHKIAVILVIVGAVVWFIYGLTAGRVNVVERVFGSASRSGLARTIFILVGLAAAYVMFDRDLYLPFLGETVIPNGALPEKTPERWSEKAVVDVPANTKVIFWAAEPVGEGSLGQVKGPAEAYSAYENAGVTVSSADGKAELRVRSPQSYRVPVRGLLEPHIHYRIYTSDGMLGRVKTVFLKDGKVEGFTDF